MRIVCCSQPAPLFLRRSERVRRYILVSTKPKIRRQGRRPPAIVRRLPLGNECLDAVQTNGALTNRRVRAKHRVLGTMSRETFKWQALATATLPPGHFAGFRSRNVPARNARGLFAPAGHFSSNTGSLVPCLVSDQAN